ncbi:MAG: helix-turn-helix domain-containing protein [Rhodospirillaceae bacterium]|nr:helix-turn-helix domain-containing protein [Rhodospirillaceae bacterium]MCA8933627.1 helix-turn-helix domain-containing protein [Rhodospirillaceae bacterium]
MRVRRDIEPTDDYDMAESQDDSPEAFEWTVSRILRYAREQAGYSVRDVADILKIRQSQIYAIEEGRFRDLPATVYAIGFVRSYAELLSLDGDEVVRRFKEESTGVSVKPALVFPTPVPEGRMPGGAVLMIAILLAIGSYGGWYYLSNHSTEVVEHSDFVPERFVALSEQGGGSGAPARSSGLDYEPSAANAAEGEDGPSAVYERPAGLREQAGDEPAAELEMAAIDEEQADGSAARQVDGEWPAGATPPVAPEPPPGRNFGAADGEIELRATAESWVQLNDARGALVMTRILRPGDTYVVPDGEGLRLITGNAGGLDILIDGQVAPPLGGQGTVVRDVLMDPERLLNGTAAAN